MISRAPDAPGPTSREVTSEKQDEIYKDLVPLPPLGVGVAGKTPDGEVWDKYPNGLMIHDLIPSEAQEALWGQTVKIAYIGTFPGQTKPFDQRGKDNPFSFQVGSTGVIMGFNMGIAHMKVGGKRRIFVPPDLGYGAAGNIGGGILPNQALIFEVQLLAVEGPPLDMPEPPKTDVPTATMMAGPPAPATVPATAP